MAYLDLSEATLNGTVSSVTAPQESTRFDARELAVIRVAQHDTPASLSAPGRFRRTLETFFGVRRGNPFADPRLEALRRMAVLLRRGLDRVSGEETARFLASGFSHIQLAALAQHVTAGRR